MKEKERERIRDKDMKKQRIREAGTEIEECKKIWRQRHKKTKSQRDRKREAG